MHVCKVCLQGNTRQFRAASNFEIVLQESTSWGSRKDPLLVICQGLLLLLAKRKSSVAVQVFKMAFSGGLSGRMDELRFPNHRTSGEGYTYSGYTSPQRNAQDAYFGNFQQTSNDARSSLQRRRTTDSSKMSGSSFGGQYPQGRSEYSAVVSPAVNSSCSSAEISSRDNSDPERNLNRTPGRSFIHCTVDLLRDEVVAAYQPDDLLLSPHHVILSHQNFLHTPFCAPPCLTLSSLTPKRISKSNRSELKNVRWRSRWRYSTSKSKRYNNQLAPQAWIVSATASTESA